MSERVVQALKVWAERELHADTTVPKRDLEIHDIRFEDDDSRIGCCNEDDYPYVAVEYSYLARTHRHRRVERIRVSNSEELESLVYAIVDAVAEPAPL